MSVYNDLTHAREAIRVLIGVLPVSAFNALTAQIVDRPEIILAIAEATDSVDELMAALEEARAK